MASENGNPKILVVDDDPLMRDFVVDLIESFGYSVVAAGDSLEAMAMIAEAPTIELVFTDITMPGLNGLMLADMLKHHRPKLKIIYTTGGYKVTRVRAEAGILHGPIIEKPYRPEELRLQLQRSFA